MWESRAKCLESNDAIMYLTHNEGKSAAVYKSPRGLQKYYRVKSTKNARKQLLSPLLE